MADKDSLDILLIGRAGRGKSTTGNKILGRETFVSTGDTESKTKHISYDFCDFEGNNIKVVDCPGLGDTRLSRDLDVKQLSDAIQKAIEEHPNGFHAILYIVRFGNRFDEFDVKALETIEQIMGEDFIKDHCIILMTGGDLFETDPAIKKEKLTFEKWVDKQENGGFRKIVWGCKKRIILFDNRTDDQQKIHAQMWKLIEMIKVNGKRYTKPDFEKAEGKRMQLIDKLRDQTELQGYIDALGVLTSRLKNTAWDQHGCDTLQAAKTEAKNLKVTVQKKQSQNKKLRSALNLFDLFLQNLESKIQLIVKFMLYTEDVKINKSKFEELEKEYLQIKMDNL